MRAHALCCVDVAVVVVVEERNREHEIQVAVVAHDLIKAIRHEVDLPLELFHCWALNKLDRLGECRRAHR